MALMGDEFVGPFANWDNLQSDYGAVGNGTADDSDAVEDMFTAVGTTGVVPCCWVPAGDYRITRTLRLHGRECISILGEHPETTSFTWDGDAGDSMFWVDGINYSRFSRFTFDGQGGARTCIRQSYSGSGTGGFFDTGNEYADNIGKDAEFFMEGGDLSYGFAETSVLRTHILRMSKSAFFIWNFNGLDLWSWYNTIEDCQNGFANYLPEYSMTGAGAWRAYNTVFLRTVKYDNVINNTSNFSLRDCYSIGAERFWHSYSQGSANNLTIQGCKLLDHEDAGEVTIYAKNCGPTHIYDNVIRSKVGASYYPVIIGEPGNNADAIILGNTVTVGAVAILDSVSGGRMFVGSDNVVSYPRASIDDSIPFDMPGFEPNLGRTIFEVTTAGSIQTAVNSAHALGTRAVVHVQEGTYGQVTTTQANSDVQIIGDGGLLRTNGGDLIIEGPTKVKLSEISGTVTVRNVDQVGSRIRSFGIQARAGSANTILIDRLDHAVVEFFDSQFMGLGPNGLKVIGGALANAGTPAGGKTIFYSGVGSHFSVNIYDFSDGAQVTIRDVWYEEAAPAEYRSDFGLKTSGATVTVTLEGGKIAQWEGEFASIQNVTGLVSLLCNMAGGDTLIGSNGKVLAAGHLMMQDYLPAHDYFVNSGAGTARLLNSREWTNTPIIPGEDTDPTTNEGVTSDALLLEMFAQTRAEHPGPLEETAAGVTDLRLFRVWPTNGVNSLHLSGQERTGFRLHFG